MNRYVADTNALYWHLVSSPRLSARARSAFQEAAAGNALIVVPAIVWAELYYLNEKQGRPLDFEAEYRALESAGFQFVSLRAEDVEEFPLDAAVPEMHDRIIAGVCRRLNAPCITADRSIRGSSIPTVW